MSKSVKDIYNKPYIPKTKLKLKPCKHCGNTDNLYIRKMRNGMLIPTGSCRDCYGHFMRISLKKLYENNPELHKKISETTRLGQTEEVREKMSLAGKGRKKTEEHKRKIRIASINYRVKTNSTGSWTRIGKAEKEILDKMELIYGPIQRTIMRIKGKYLSFVVDGYSEEKNIVFEIDEKQHFDKKHIEYDLQREQYIGNLLKCKFIRIKDTGEIYKEIDYNS
jgi:hypothetical protein